MEDHPPPPPGSPAGRFLSHLGFIEKLAAAIARRSHASAEEAEEFAAELKLKLLEDDYAALRKFKGTSTFKTYLTTVATNAFKDFRNRRWGKWRPSAAAKELGPVAIRLEELLDKEDRSFNEACEILRTNYQVKESRQELEEIWKRLPPKTQRRMEGEEELRDWPAAEERPEERIFARELRETRARVDAALKKVLRSLSTDDRLIVKLGIVDEIKVVNIARTLCMQQKPLYRRLQKIKKELRSALEREGVRWEQVADLLNRTDVGWGFSPRRPKRTED
jgi:RNA polymerase sigma factor (sigma-70 family)